MGHTSGGPSKDGLQSERKISSSAVPVSSGWTVSRMRIGPLIFDSS